MNNDTQEMKPRVNPSSGKRIRKLWFYFLILNCIPAACFFVLLPSGIVARTTILLFNIGLFAILLSLSKNPGKNMWWLFPLIFLHCFEIVLMVLFGNEPISQDMFLNLITTNTKEAGELMGSIYWVIILVIALYVPALVLAGISWRKKRQLSRGFRLKTIIAGAAILLISISLLFFNSENKKKDTLSFRNDVYPVNVLDNLYLATTKAIRVKNYYKSSGNFNFHIQKTPETDLPKIIVLVIGETSRADNWQLYGYGRATNPLLSKEKNIVVYKDVLTQSNVTHKSVPLFLSSVTAADYNDIYSRKGLMAAFHEAGYHTYFLSNQGDEFMIKNLANEADVYQTLRTENKDGSINNYPDATLFDLITGEMINDTVKSLIVLHTYGSHFKYTDRYPKSFERFTPADAKGPYPGEREKLINGYDNTIVYIDYFLSQLIDKLNKYALPSVMLYASDHGEDIFDDDRNRFLHATITPTYYQLRIPMLLWFSDEYISHFPKKYKLAKANADKPISTGSVFPTLMDLSFINTQYSDKSRSLASEYFNAPERYFLDQYDKPVPISKLNLSPEDTLMFYKNGIRMR